MQPEIIIAKEKNKIIINLLIKIFFFQKYSYSKLNESIELSQGIDISNKIISLEELKNISE